METLAVIAWKYPVLQSEVTKIRTNKAYEHLRELEEMGYITREKKGRTRQIKLTQKFFDYFDIVEKEKLKEKFKGIADKQEEKLANEIKEEAKEEMIEKISKDEKIELENKEKKVEAIVEVKTEEVEIEKSNTKLESLDPDDFGS